MSLSKTAVSSRSHSSKRRRAPSTVPDPKYFIPGFAKGVGTLLSAESNVVKYKGRAATEFRIFWKSSDPSTKNLWTMTEDINGKLSNEKVELLVPCDGGCGHKLCESQMVQFGGCEHNMCTGCMGKAKTEKVTDGMPCCCHKNCCHSAEVVEDDEEEDTIFRQVLNVRIRVYHKEKNTVIRRKKTLEVASDFPLADVRGMLKSYLPKFDKYPAFYASTNCRNSKASEAEVVPWDLTETGTIGDLTNGGEYLTFLIGSHANELFQ